MKKQLSGEIEQFGELVKEQKIRIIKKIAKDKGWDEKELLNECMKNYYIEIKKKSN